MSATKKKEKSKKADAAELAVRRSRVWELKFIDRLSQREIAEQVGVSASTVNRDLAFMSDRIMDELDDVAERETAMQVFQLRQIVDWAIRDYHASSKPKVSTTIRRKRGIVQHPVTGQPVIDVETGKAMYKMLEEITTETVTERLPVVGYLTTAMSAFLALRKLLGLDAPDKIQIDWRGELINAGIDDPDGLYNAIVDKVLEAAESGEGFVISEIESSTS